MRKIFFVLFALCAFTVNSHAITYYNVRGGIGYEPTLKYADPDIGIALMFQPNICFGKQKNIVFSPTLQFDVTVGEDVSFRPMLPLLIGYRVRLGDRTLFVPKIGPMVGYGIRASSSHGNTVLVGPYVDLCFEIHRFVIGLNSYYSFSGNDANGGPNLHITFGYKF